MAERFDVALLSCVGICIQEGTVAHITGRFKEVIMVWRLEKGVCVKGNAGVESGGERMEEEQKGKKKNEGE